MKHCAQSYRHPLPRLTATALLAWLLLALGEGASVQAACSIERTSPGAGAPFSLHLGKECSEQEREAQAVSAVELLAVLNEGRGIDLVGVTVTGDLSLDQLSLRRAEAVADLPPPIREAIRRQGLKEVRVIAGPMSIRDSVVRGKVGSQLKDGVVIAAGPVTMTGTKFERAVDFSQTAFAGPVDFSNAILLNEGFFIGSLFLRAATFEKTAFGTHTRFHKAQFLEAVTFHRAGFSGLAEFIQVSFEKAADFSRTYFKMGTGFSGSRFGGMLDFSEALFEREAFFMFTVFEQDAYFRRVTFRGETSFSDSEFKGLDDFSKTFFNTQPRFDRAKISGAPPKPGGLQDPRVLYVIAAALFAFTLLFVFVLRRR
ncbi:MAG: hypothetical protein FJ246_03950 [Nitrospira sp.]|nr:hypothetical protein [Nitrospira sp.]